MTKLRLFDLQLTPSNFSRIHSVVFVNTLYMQDGEGVDYT